MNIFKLWGREPAYWLALVSGLVILATTFGLDLTIDMQGAVNATAAAFFGLLTAWAVAKDGLQAAIMGFFKAGIYLAVSFGLNWSPEDQLKLMLGLEPIVAFFVRSQATAAVGPGGEQRKTESVAN